LSCGSSDRNIINQGDAHHKGDIEKIIWETKGGGDLYFSIERVDDQFKISIERQAFQAVHRTVILTDKDLTVYDLVEDIFEDRLKIHDYTFTPVGTTGSWTTITLIFSDRPELEIENIKATDDELRILYNFVRESAGSPN
jgi:hypothetical protein